MEVRMRDAKVWDGWIFYSNNPFFRGHDDSFEILGGFSRKWARQRGTLHTQEQTEKNSLKTHLIYHRLFKQNLQNQFPSPMRFFNTVYIPQLHPLWQYCLAVCLAPWERGIISYSFCISYNVYNTANVQHIWWKKTNLNATCELGTIFLMSKMKKIKSRKVTNIWGETELFQRKHSHYK